MSRRLFILSLFLVFAGLVSAQARTMKMQQIDCVKQGLREFCTSESHKALNGKVAVQGKDGNLTSISDFKKGYRNGESLFYDNKGNMTERITFRDGIIEGVILYYHRNGKVWISAPYTKGELHGSVDIYDESGKIRGKFKYDRGHLKRGYCKRKGEDKIKYPNSKSLVEYNQLVTCGAK